MIIAVDPGDTAGVAIFDDTGIFVSSEQLSGAEEFAELCLKLAKEPITTIVVEDYRLMRHKAQQQAGSRFQAVQQIGMLKLLAKQAGANIVIQGPDKYPIGLLLSGKQMPKDHKKSHHVVAYAHGWYYLVQQGLVLPVVPNLE
jgi:hypothetical protein